MSRDWQKDMELFEEGIKQARELGFSPTIESSPYQIAIYWLQQYAVEKERADIAELAHRTAKEELARMNALYYGDKQSFIEQRRELAETIQRADQEKHNHRKVRAMLNDEQVAHSITKDREQQLREAVKAIKERAELALDGDRHDNYGLAVALTAIRQRAHENSLYPKEEEAK